MCLLLLHQDTCISQVMSVVEESEVTMGTIDMFVALLQVIVNFTTLEESHTYVLPHIQTLYQLLQQSEVVKIKVCSLYVLPFSKYFSVIVTLFSGFFPIPFYPTMY